MIEELFPILSTPDLPRALAFYRDLLGGVVTYQFPAEGDPGYVGLALGVSHLGIGAQDQPGGWSTTGSHCGRTCRTAMQHSYASGAPVSRSCTRRPTSPGASAWPGSVIPTGTS